MAVTSVIQHSAGASGTASPGGKGTTKRIYSSRYRVFVDDVQDAPTEIHNYFKATSTLPWIGRAFRWGNGVDTNSTCVSLVVDYVEKSEGQYDVRASFDPDGAGGDEPTDEGGTGADGEPTDDPLEFRHEIEVGYTQISEPVERAIYRGGHRASAFLQEGKLLPVMNSAGVEIDPGIEEVLHIKVVRITKPVLTYDGNIYNKLIGVVNSDHVVIDKSLLYGFREEFSPQVGKIYNISANLQWAPKRGPYYLLTTEIHINPQGWRRSVLDRGMSSIIAAGLPNGTGLSGEAGYYSAADVPAAGLPRQTPIINRDGYPLNEPIQLNGSGQPRTATEDPIWLQWQTLPEVEFSELSALWS